MYEDSDSDNEGNLTIVIESPERLKAAPKKPVSANLLKRKRVSKSPNKRCSRKKVDEADVKNVDATDVKRILKEVLTNENVLSLVRQIVNPGHLEPSLTSEEKITRSKAKKLLSTQRPPPLLGTKTAPKPSDFQKLIQEDLQEDSSGDEYIPGTDEVPSEDDEASFPKNIDNATQTSWADDGAFKIPHPVQHKESKEETLNIALRTRSKLSLSSTPLEVIEKAFVPPDITTDMYDLECDDDVWKDFLQNFTTPIDEITKCGEDEDHDPEYNAAAEDDIPEHEEFRADDEDVEVPLEEVNELLVGFLNDQLEDANEDSILKLNTPNLEFLEPESPYKLDYTSNEPQLDIKIISPAKTKKISSVVVDIEENNEYELWNHVVTIDELQCKTLMEQMEQHVQVLTLNFIQSYKHDDYHEISVTSKEFLRNCKDLGAGKNHSFFHPVNLDGALNLIETWTEIVDADGKEVQEMRDMQQQTNYTVFEFSKIILDFVSASDVFIYPTLLPKSPFIPMKLLSTIKKKFWNTPLNNLLAFALDQFYEYLKPKRKTKTGWDFPYNTYGMYINEFIMPSFTAEEITSHLKNCKHFHDSNPVKYFWKHRKLPPNFAPALIQRLPVMPPLKRDPNDFVAQWRKHVYPNIKYKRKKADREYYLSNVTAKDKPIQLYRMSIHTIEKKYQYKTGPRKIFVKPNCYQSSLDRCFKANPVQIAIDPYIKELKFNTEIFANMDKTSMPLLFEEAQQPMENLSEPTAQNNGESEKKEPEIVRNEKDNLEDINALMRASSVINNQNKRRLSAAEKKKKKVRKEYSANLNLLLPENPQEEKENLNNFVQAFYDKVQERLDVSDCNKFLQILSEFESDQSPLELFKNIDSMLRSKYPDIAEEFLAFMTPEQAQAMGKFVPYFMLTNMTLFLRKLEVHFKDQPSQVKKIYRSLNEMCECLNLTMEKIKTAIIPLLKGNQLLIDWFLQLFPTEKPPNGLLNGPSDTLQVGKGIDGNLGKGGANEDMTETIVLPDVEDPYGGPNCICDCHKTHNDDEAFKTRARHCIPCGTKFLQGRVYVQTGKGLRLAKIVFNTPNVEEQYARVGYYSNNQIPNKKRCDSSPSKNISTSPNKETHTDEGKSLSSDEDGADCRRKVRANAVRSPRKKKNTGNDNSNKAKSAISLSSPKVDKQTNNKSSPNVDAEAKTHQSGVEKMDWDCNAFLHASPEHTSALDESENEFCEESSQDNLSDAVEEELQDENCLLLSPTHSDSSNSNPVSDPNDWTREEDRIILQTFQSEGNNEETFKHVAEKLENRSIDQIKNRFFRLINLLQEMAAAGK